MRPISIATIRTVAALLAVASGGAFAADAPDVAQGKKLYEQHCTGCHIRMLGGDGTTIHTRKNSIIHSLSALQQRVAFCSTQINAHLFPEEEADIAAWLNEKFYKFK
jgi:cytochrome c